MSLVSEFLWFQRYITDHELETQLEIEDDKIVFWMNKKLIKWGLEEARRIRTEVITDSEQSYRYARIINNRFELGEPTIAKNIGNSYYYAKNVIKGRFELGEPEIAKNACHSYLYARDVIKGRFGLGESVILKDAEGWSQRYATFLKNLGTR